MANTIKELVGQIQNEAVDSNSDLGSLLRKCKLLAAQLGSKPLEDWLIWESAGYPDDVDVPKYRIWTLQLKGEFHGIGGRGYSNVPIPSIAVPEKDRLGYQEYNYRQSISGIQTALKDSKDDRFSVATGDLSVAIGTNLYEGFNCIKVWAEIPKGYLIEVINKDGVLSMSLAYTET